MFHSKFIQNLKGLKGSGLKTRILNPIDELLDFMHGVKTSGSLEVEGDGSRPYEPSPYSAIRTILNKLNLTPSDTFVDIGCGLARPVLYAASKYPLAKAVEVDLSEELILKARQNTKNLKNALCHIEFHHQPAQQFNFDEVTAIYLYNPFGEKPMNEMLEALHQSLINNPRELRIAYGNPYQRHVFADKTWLQPYDSLSNKEAKMWTFGKPTFDDDHPAVIFYRYTPKYH